MWRPLLRFIALGGALFVADRLFSGDEPPEPLSVPGERVAAVREAWQRREGRPPDAAELVRALEPAIEEELLYREALRRGWMREDPVVFRRLVQNLRFAGADPARADAELFQEALALGLHESDPVVRRRLAQRMRFALEAAGANETPDEPALRAHYRAERDRYRSPARVAFRQLFFETEARAGSALARLRVSADAEVASDPFLHSDEQPPQTREELAARFGAEFANGLFAAEPGGWRGPLRSAYGLHAVRVLAREPAREPPFESVRERVRLSWLAERRERAFREGLAALRAGVELRIEADGAGPSSAARRRSRSAASTPSASLR